MLVRKLGHACLLIEQDDARLLLDPGIFSSDLSGITGLTGVLITHQHTDHVDPATLGPLLEANADATVHTDAETVGLLAAAGITATAVQAGETLSLGTEVRVFGQKHAVIHPDVPQIPNVCFLLAGRIFHPGDSLTVPEVDVEILALPAAAPWMKSSEGVDYLRAVRPRAFVPIHDGLLVPRAKPLYYGMFERLGPQGAELRVLDDGQPVDF
jgi:L-ascorbate metabolism protein UlaG (beta-lactamase superfamily)